MVKVKFSEKNLVGQGGCTSLHSMSQCIVDSMWFYQINHPYIEQIRKIILEIGFSNKVFFAPCKSFVTLFVSDLFIFCGCFKFKQISPQPWRIFLFFILFLNYHVVGFGGLVKPYSTKMEENHMCVFFNPYRDLFNLLWLNKLNTLQILTQWQENYLYIIN